MFKKLLSNLPFNPSLIGQVSFYSQRLHKETLLRKAGLAVLILALFVQLFAVISPPEPTLARSGNDIIEGGFSTKDQAVQNCNGGVLSEFWHILNYYGVSCAALSTSQETWIKSTDYDNQLNSMGRWQQGPTISSTGKPTDEYPVTVNGVQYYMRNLWAWDSYAYSNYKVLKILNDHGQIIMVMFDCGNIITVGQFTPPPKEVPKEEPKKEEPKKEIPKKVVDVCLYKDGVQTSSSECDVCDELAGIQTQEAECKPCDKAKERTDQAACLILGKHARNISQNIANADGTTVKASDTVQYVLSVKNTGKTTVKDYVIQENIGDVLEYADVTDPGTGAVDEKQVIRWKGADIKAGETLERNFMIRIKDPIPNTPVSTSNPGSFDLTMTNVYGDAINIKLPKTVIKTTEQTIKTLPNTGPGESMAMIILAVMVFSYFFARSRLMGTELDIVRTEFAASGGTS